ncbi:DUF4157 domain-containing protein [Pseudanabaena sp. 'Roaring Creek']|uniref:eCIS core domain-containing protein n=1 Tax=Pseudanabaena sp. 'Roaring Creek' TaxID=1681830 RepID=UPI0006D7A543|nr:DUF4157 domain-containing protein [Pseudanabaena sp. 'Roaring Creek']
MKRIYEKSYQPVTSPQHTTLNLQTRGFAPPQTESSTDVSAPKHSDYSENKTANRSENILEKLISAPSSASSGQAIQRKPHHRLRAAYAEQMAIQAKLNIGEPNDKYEKEADATATKVVQQINAPTSSQSIQKQDTLGTEEEGIQRKLSFSRIQRRESIAGLPVRSLLQRRGNLDGGEAEPDLEASIQTARGGGQSLDPHLQTKMGQAMGADFSSVRVHTDSRSDQLNKSIQAKAFTTGRDVFFRQGAYNPSSKGGQELIAHELTHVVQQNGAQNVANRSTNKSKLSRKLERSQGTQVPASPIKVSLSSLSHDQTIQRLSLHDTDWKKATRFRASEGGVGGVIFVSDNKSTLVVKPNVREKDEEMIASHLHGSMASTKKNDRGGKWNIANLDRRFAIHKDVVGIQARASNFINDLDARTQTLLGAVAVNTTMIQEAAQGVSGFGELMQDQTQNGGHITSANDRTFGKKDKVNKNSPLKLLTQDPSFAIALGRLAAADIFLGNFDRIVGSANLDNLLMNMSQGKIYPIDNVDPGSRVKFTEQVGAQKITLQNWLNHPLVAMFINANYDAIAAEAWDSGHVTTNTHMKFIDEIITGEKVGANPREYNVNPNERVAVTNKLNNHLQVIMANFAQGLAIGRAEIIRTGPLQNTGQVSNDSVTLYNDRLNAL